MAMQNASVIYELNRCRTLQGKLRFLGLRIKEKYPLVERFSIALYQPTTRSIRTFFTTSAMDEAITGYDIPLADSPSLQQIADQKMPRVISDLVVLAEGQEDAVTYHTEMLVKQGWRSSFTCPLIVQGDFVGFLFFNSKTPAAFKGPMLLELELYSQLIAQVVQQDYAAIHALTASVHSAVELFSDRNEETRHDLERIGDYTRMVASSMGGKWTFTDRQIQNMAVFAPLHDVGKLALPDSILLKPGPLTSAEFNQVKGHTWRGLEFLERVISKGGMGHLPDIQMLKNIILYHHEKMDGTGYPDSLSGEAIPIEARVVAVADVFEALLTDQPYRPAFTVDEALAEVQSMAGHHLDPECVQALLNNRDRLISMNAVVS